LAAVGAVGTVGKRSLFSTGNGLIRGRGFNVGGARTFELVISDIGMPEMDGYDL